MYSYNVPRRGNSHSVHIDESMKDGQRYEAAIHTHGRYDPDYKNFVPSQSEDGDINTSFEFGKHRTFDFLVGPDGVLTYYGYSVDKDGNPYSLEGPPGVSHYKEYQRVVGASFPSDQNSPGHTNNDARSGADDPSVRDSSMSLWDYYFD